MQIMWKDGFHKKLKVSIVAPFSKKYYREAHIVENIPCFFGLKICQEWVILSS